MSNSKDSKSFGDADDKTRVVTLSSSDWNSMAGDVSAVDGALRASSEDVSTVSGASNGVDMQGFDRMAMSVADGISAIDGTNSAEIISRSGAVIDVSKEQCPKLGPAVS